MPTRTPNVVFVILDAFPHACVDDDRTPVLWGLAREGGRAASGGRALLSASTYPNHASFVTGVGPDVHHIVTSKALVGDVLRPAQEVGPAAPTLFDRCAAAGLRAVAAFGDQNLVGVCGARRAAAHWPPDGVLPDAAPRGALGFGADDAVVEALDSLDPASADLCVVQLDLVDTVRHLHGADSAEATAQYRATDAALGEILQRFAPRWSDTVVIVVSDHDHEDVRPGAIDLAAAAAERGLDVRIDHDGTAAFVLGDVEPGALLVLPGVTGAASVGARRSVVWGDAGQQFGIDWGLKAQHGSPRTATQLAIIGGGHPAASRLARRLAGEPPPGTRWAGWIGELLALG